MKNKLVLLTILLALALFSAACAAQDTTNVPGEVTAISTVPADDGTATEEAGETVTAPTGTAEGEATTEGTAETEMTPTGAADSSTPAQDTTSGTAEIPQTGAGDAGRPDDLDEVIRVLRTAGATVELGDAVEQADVSVAGQSIMINGEEVQIFTYTSAEKLEAQASQLARENDPEAEPQFYKLGNMLVRYIGSNTLVRDLLEDVLGAQAAGQ